MGLEYTFFAGTDDEAAIPEEDVRTSPKWKERIVHGNQKIIADSLDIELINDDPDQYDDRNEGSLFYQKDFYKSIVTIYDNDHGLYIWKGFMINLTVSDESVTVHTVNYIMSLNKTDCIYDNTSGGNETPAEAIYNILINVVGIPEDDIIYGDFQKAISIQDDAGLYVKVKYLAKDKKKCIQAVNELCRISQCHLYTRENKKICLYQWEEWQGLLGHALNARDVISKSYSHTFDSDMILNNFYIAYGTSSVLYADIDDAGSETQALSAASIVKYDERVFNVPDSSVDDNSVDNFKILITTSAGAVWAGEQAVKRFHELKKICALKLGIELDHLRINDQVDLDFESFTREPARIIEKESDKEEQTVQIKAEFLNTPYEYYSRDMTAPSPVWIESAIPVIGASGGVRLRFTQSLEDDHLGYKIYFTVSKGRWNTEQCNLGRSPVDVKNPDIENGYCIADIYQLTPGVEYYFKITSYDTGMNESEDSNIITYKLPDFEGSENLYMLQKGSTGKFLLDINNSEAGTVPDEFTIYTDFDSNEFDKVITAFYQSPWIISESGFDKAIIRGIGDPGDIKYQYRTEEGGVWTDPEDSIGIKMIDFEGALRIQVRLIFYSPNWSDDDSVFISDLREVA